MPIIPPTDQEHFLKIMHELADLSAEAIRPYFRTHFSVDEKLGKGVFDPVTDADRASERAIRSFIEQNLPDHSILGEEFGKHEGSSDYCWVVDPIDGTRAFMMGSPLWGTLIGLTVNGDPLMGMMNQPFTKERFWATPQGAFGCWNETTVTLTTSETTDLAQATLTSTCPDLFKCDRDLAAFHQLGKKCRMTRFGGDCYLYCLLAMGTVDLVVETGLQPYDIVPLIPLVQQSGGVITNWQGDDVDSSGQVIAAANANLHQAALAVLNLS